MFLHFKRIESIKVPVVTPCRVNDDDMELFLDEEIYFLLFSLVEKYHYLIIVKSLDDWSAVKLASKHFIVENHYLCIGKSYLSFFRKKNYHRCNSFEHFWLNAREKLLSN